MHHLEVKMILFNKDTTNVIDHEKIFTISKKLKHELFYIWESS